MLFTIAKVILVFVLLVVLVIVISLVVWGVKEIIRWLRKERNMDDIRLEKRTIQERLIIAKTLIETALSDLPTVEIVRCKDCKWFGEIGCAISVVDDTDKPTENDFCSFAERRTDG